MFDSCDVCSSVVKDFDLHLCFRRPTQQTHDTTQTLQRKADPSVFSGRVGGVNEDKCFKE